MQCIMGFLGRHGKQGFSCGQVPKSSSKSDQIRPRKTDLSSGCLVDLGASALLLLLLLRCLPGVANLFHLNITAAAMETSPF